MNKMNPQAIACGFFIFHGQAGKNGAASKKSSKNWEGIRPDLSNWDNESGFNKVRGKGSWA
jgi:hypothetical protein